jgi:hypothetical protein
VVQPKRSRPGDFGPTFVPRPTLRPELGRWYRYEFIVQGTTAGRRDGRALTPPPAAPAAWVTEDVRPMP